MTSSPRCSQPPTAITGPNTIGTQLILEIAGQKNPGAPGRSTVEGYSGMQARAASIPPAAQPRLTESIRRLVDLYTAWDKPDEAAKWRKVFEESAEKPLPNKEPANDNDSP